MAEQKCRNLYVMKGPLFAAANGRNGFTSFYDSIFKDESIKKRYLIKGGPGTGKSTFMKRVAAAAEDAGVYVEYYRCSSDPDSLDGVIIGGRTAILDATAPHNMDVSIAGAVDEIIDLGIFWNARGLSERADEIKALSGIKNDHYRRAYRILSAAGDTREASLDLVMPFVRRDKIKRAVRATMEKLPRGDGYFLKAGLCDSLGMKGKVGFDTYERSSSRVYCVEDCYGVGNVFLGMMAEAAAEYGHVLRVSYEPIDTTSIDGLLLEDVGVAYVLSGKMHAGNGIKINTKRFLDIGAEDKKRIRREYRFGMRLYDGLVESAMSALEEAGEAHFALEEIYKSYVDFAAQTRFCTSFSEMLVADLLDSSQKK